MHLTRLPTSGRGSANRGLSLMSSGERLKIDAERSTTRVGEDDPGIVRAEPVVFWTQWPQPRACPGGSIPLPVFGVAPGISNFFLPIGDVFASLALY